MLSVTRSISVFIIEFECHDKHDIVRELVCTLLRAIALFDCRDGDWMWCSEHSWSYMWIATIMWHNVRGGGIDVREKSQPAVIFA